MEITEITIKDFKGIKKVRMRPIKNINVLIGRNNSGKSSILTALQFLSKYFDALKSKPGTTTRSSVEVPNEYLRRGLEQNPELSMSVTIAQSKEERKQQFSSVVEIWNKDYSSPQMSTKAIDIQLENNLFSTLTFDFVTKPDGKQFGMSSIMTECKSEKGESIEIPVAQGSPGGTLSIINISQLFILRHPAKPYPRIYELAGELRFKDDWGIQYDRGGSLQGKTGPDSFFIRDLILPSFNHIKKMFDTSFLVSPYRHAIDRMIGVHSTQLRNDGSNLVEYMHNLALNQHDVFENIAGFVKGIVPEVGRLHPRFTGAKDDSLELAYDWPEGRLVNLANMGGGVEQLLILGCLLVHQRTSCILWEEPESHLHPGAQELLLNELEKRVGDSLIFLSSQSPVFIRPSVKIAVHAIMNPDGKNAASRTLSKDELQEAATVIGSRPGHLAQADIVVYVEGKTGAAAVKEWLNKWPEKDTVLGYLQLEAQSLNVDEVASEETLLRALKKVSPNLVIFVDRDNDPGKIEPKKSRTLLLTNCEKMGIPCIITETRQIEDYFTYEGVKKGLPSNLCTNFERPYDNSKTIGEQFQDGWKLYNYRIAAAMDWKDVEQRKGIQRLLAEIKTYAKKLRPEWDTKSE